ncbi:MAG: MBL fold metallo-hydrolase, partial [Pseudomonadales bacterium]|nr:MBL fold metallo-hydrolase [Pseudomonadales bacterium]
MHLADLVEGETEVIADQLHIRPAPGHTPGSVTIDLHSQGKSALFTGDICHHPLQVYFPDWNSAYCELPTQARETRHRILAESEAAGKLLMPAHFGASFCGYVRADDSGFSFDFSHN